MGSLSHQDDNKKDGGSARGAGEQTDRRPWGGKRQPQAWTSP